MDLVKILKSAEKFTADNAPAILTGAAIAGTLATAYLSVTSTVKAMDHHGAEIIRAKRFGRPVPEKKEVVLLVWRYYIPPVVTGVLTVGAIVGANHVSTRRATAMAAAYTISERAFTEYKEKVVEKIGEKKEQSYRDEIAQERVEKDPVENKHVIITGNGEVLCYEMFTGRYFSSDMETIRRAENEINHQILHQGYASLNDFYHEVGLPRTSLSEELGWNTDQLLEIKVSATLSQDDRPCLAIDYNTQPYRKFDMWG